MFNKFCSAQNLRILQNYSPVPEPILDLALLYRRAFESDARGTRITDVMAFDDLFHKKQSNSDTSGGGNAYLDAAEYALLKDWIAEHDGPAEFRNTVKLQEAVDRLGEVISTEARSAANSCVAFPEASGSWTGGKVYKLFSHCRSVGGEKKVGTFALVRPFAGIRHDHKWTDAYSRYHVAGGRIFYNRFISDTVGILSIDDIICHTANLAQNIDGIDEVCISVIPLNKVSWRPAHPILCSSECVLVQKAL